jgi:hypothetical protein
MGATIARCAIMVILYRACNLPSEINWF